MLPSETRMPGETEFDRGYETRPKSVATMTSQFANVQFPDGYLRQL